MATKKKLKFLGLLKKLYLRFALLAVVTAVLINSIVSAKNFTPPTNIKVFTGDFEAGDFSGWKKELCCDYSAEIVNSPVRAGKHAVKFTLKEGDPVVSSSKRAELKLDAVPANSEQWYGFSNYLPKDWMYDSSYEIVAQFHNQPDASLGEDWRSPALMLMVNENNWRVSNRWDSKQVTKNNKPQGSEGWDVGEIGKERWTDWVFHVKWSSKSDGLLEVWKDGKLVVSKTGPNTYNDEKGPFLKLGVYKPHWKYKPELSRTKERIIYIDEVRLGDNRVNYEAVVPRYQPTFFRK